MSFSQRLYEAVAVPSVETVADLYDNALAKSFVATLKREVVERALWPTRDSARGDMFEYIEVFYNRRRPHSALGHQSPTDYEEVRMKKGVAA